MDCDPVSYPEPAEELSLSFNLREIVQEMNQLKAEIDTRQARYKQLRALLVSSAGFHKGVFPVPDTPFTIKVDEAPITRRCDYRALERNFPAAFRATVTVVAPSDPWRVTIRELADPAWRTPKQP